MIESIKTQNGRVNILTAESLIDLHDLLSNNVHLLAEMDPIEPRGVKNLGMLESAVGRQSSGFGEYYKYPDCFSNCATLTFGIIKNHSFHNGNKRAGLLALIKHLYVNGYVLSPSLESKELYEFLVAIADSKIQEFSYKYKKKYSLIRSKSEKKENPTWDIDTIIRYMALWIKKNARPKKTTFKGDVKVSDLKRFLDNKGIKLEQNGSNLEIYIVKENNFLGIPLGSKKTHSRKYSLGNNRTMIGLGLLKLIRRDFNLTKSDGIDNTFFYNDDAFLDHEIKTYKKLIYRLSKT